VKAIIAFMVLGVTLQEVNATVFKRASRHDHFEVMRLLGEAYADTDKARPEGAAALGQMAPGPSSLRLRKIRAGCLEPL
jgi:hypothetical protein